MFEGQPEASAPIRQLRFAPSIAEPLPLSVQLALSAEEEFTDNADQTKNNRRSEFRTRIVPGLSVRSDRPWGNVSLAYAPEVFIPNNSIGETDLNQNLSLRFGLWPSGRFQFNIANDFTDSTDFRDVQDPGTQRTGTDRFLQNTATAEAAYIFPKLRTALAYTNLLNQEDQVVRDRVVTDTRISHVVRPNATYTDPRFSISGAYTLERGNENSSLQIPYWSHRGDAQVLFVVTPTVSTGVRGYYQYQEPDLGRDFTTATGRAVADVRVGPDGTLRLEAGADGFKRQGDATDIRPGFLAAYTHRFPLLAVTARYEQGYSNQFNELDSSGVAFNRSAGVLLSSSFFRNLTATLGFRYEENQYQITTLAVRSGQTDRTFDVEAGMRYLLVRALYLTLAYTGTFRVSTQESEEFNENRVRLGLTYQYVLF
ncbi:MAG: hypothetical protein EHM71_09960 [Zetaproteobacteria bacterium]|nr:MAG: hypothetical protein EHM71_09960 [Zetaproteobacteria bacterium]